MRVHSVILCIAAFSIVTLAAPRRFGNLLRRKRPPRRLPSLSVFPSRYLRNLQVLPKDITKPQLVSIMKGFSITFGVRCAYCHTVTDDLTEGKFDPDDKKPSEKLATC